MKYFLTLCLSVFFAVSAWAQPANDNCANLISLGTAPVCTGTFYTNVDATDSSSGPTDNPSCFNGGTTQNDVFFSFMVDPTLVNVTIAVAGTASGPNGVAITNPQLAVYRGSCSGLAELFCVSGTPGSSAVSLDALGLTPGIPYFIRINDYSGTGTPNWGDFTVCITEYIPAINIGEVAFSESCTGTLYDSGGPDNDYGNGENAVFTVCPTDFTQCIALDVAYFDIVPGDELNIFAGNSVNDTEIASLVGNSDGTDFQVLASSGCVTFQFISGGTNVGAGFDIAWSCSIDACGGSTFSNPTTIGSIPYANTNLTTCGQGATFNTSPCNGDAFLNGPETVFLYQSPGGLCASVQVLNASSGTGVLVLNGLPGDPGTVCVATSTVGSINNVNFQEPGDYYIVVANPEGCTDFGLILNETECSLSPALVDALCNPLNGCIQAGQIVTQFMFEDGFQDIPLNPGVNDGCWFGVGAQPDYYWFTIEAQADGPFGFIMQSANVPSDIDFNVWGPFTPEQVCDTPQFVINAVTTTQPIRSSYDGGTEPTGLADIHPLFGYQVLDEYDCEGLNDDVVRTIDAQQGEVYVVLANDWGNQIQDGGILIDWGPSDPDVLAPLGATVAAADTSVCAGNSVQLQVITGLDNIEWIGANASELSCTNCFNPVATPGATRVYRALLDAVCYVDTLEVTVNVFDLDAGPDIEVCIGEEFEIPAGQDFDSATYSWSPPAGLTFSCTECPTPSVTAAAPGVYEVPVTLTADGCSFMDMLTVTVLDFSAPVYEVADDEQICNGEERLIGGEFVTGNTYTWTSVPDVGAIEAISNPIVQPSVTTTFFLSVTNGQCPTPSRDSITLSVVQLPIISIVETPPTICLGDTISLSNSTVENDVTYSWTGPNFIFNPDSTFTRITPAVSGPYTLTGERLGCPSQDVVQVNVTPIAINLNQPDTTFICQGRSVQVNASVTPSNTTVVWNPATVSGATPLLAPNTFTTYIATVSEGSCVRIDTFSIQVDSLPGDMAIMADPMKDSYCQGELVTLTSPIYDPAFYPDIEHSWVGIGLETSDTLYNMVLTTADTFTYQRITINGGCAQTEEITLNVISNEALAITPAQPQICPGESVQLTVAAPGLGDLTWTPAETLSCDDCPNPTATPNNTTTYEVKATIEGCAIEQSVTVAVLSPATLATRNEADCFGTTYQLNPAGGQAGTTYLWTSSTDPNFSSTDPNPVVTPAVSTIFTGTATNVCGTATATVNITVIEQGTLVSVAGGAETLVVCSGVPFDLVAVVQNSANAPSQTLTWIYNNQPQTGATTTFTATESGLATFSYQYGATANDNCEELTGEVFIQVNDSPVTALIDDQTICFNDIQTFVLNEAGGQPGVTYSWTSPNNPGFSSMEPDPEVTPTTTTTYDLEAALGDCVSNESVTITVTPAATLTAGAAQVVTENMGTVTLEATATSAAPEQIFWTFEGAVIGTGSPFAWTPTSVQRDSLPGYAIATLDTGCEILTDSLLVQILRYRVPNIFSPNGDEINSVFKPFFLGEMDVVEVKVYNRWGQLVFESADPNNLGWDGIKDGTPVPSDVYIYSVKVGVGNETLTTTGEVTLVR
ncbi:MAG: hypothetical protein DA408_15895 [Bacteroidetes bacterium]|nr:MAG: hypothetical protein DA408_15895 [Bacteroidota bacterium]